MQGICTYPFTGSHVNPKWCSKAISAAYSICLIYKLLNTRQKHLPPFALCRLVLYTTYRQGVCTLISACWIHLIFVGNLQATGILVFRCRSPVVSAPRDVVKGAVDAESAAGGRIPDAVVRAELSAEVHALQVCIIGHGELTGRARGVCPYIAAFRDSPASWTRVVDGLLRG